MAQMHNTGTAIRPTLGISNTTGPSVVSKSGSRALCEPELLFVVVAKLTNAKLFRTRPIDLTLASVAPNVIPSPPGQDLDVDIVELGTDSESDVEGQIGMLETGIASNPLAIVIAPARSVAVR
jgi:hypothetical protein